MVAADTHAQRSSRWNTLHNEAGEFLGLVRPAENAAGAGHRRFPAGRQLHGVRTYTLTKMEIWPKLRAGAHFIVQCRQKTTLISLLSSGAFD